ncbi:MAG: hypothetical protein EXR99_04205 [Gemmataceae bacterium]|nr:hypothetical protein [Gemmataceae bacterium]
MRKMLQAVLVALVFFTAFWLSGPGVNNSTLAQPQGLRYWKGNLHTHSLWSDGNDFPDMITDWFKKHGYDFLALTEHNILAEGDKWVTVEKGVGAKGKALEKYLARFGPEQVEQKMEKGKLQVRLKPLSKVRAMFEEPGKFLMIPAEEITHKFAKYPIHMNGLNIKETVKPVDGASVRETIQVNLRNLSAQGKKHAVSTLGFLNHPNFRESIPAEEILTATDLKFFEVFNGHPGVRNYGGKDFPSCEQIWDIALSVRLGKLNLPILYGLATDDSHEYHDFGAGKTNPGRGWVMVRSEKLEPALLLEAMKRGDFYSSTGVILEDIHQAGDVYRFKIKPEEGVAYRTQFLGTLKGTPLEGQAAKDKDGKPVQATGTYSSGIGQVLAEIEGENPEYKITGKEIYLRARVVSSKLHKNPFLKGDKEMAWTQPILPLRAGQ